MRALAFAACLLTLFASGCASDDGDGADPDPTGSPPDTSSYTIVVSDFPVGPIEAGDQFRFNSTISGSVTRASDHIGGHFGNKSSDAPSTTVYSGACVHVSGNLPGRYQVTCTAPMEAGVYYLRGHARITTGAEQANWWSDEQTFTVTPQS